MAKKEQSELPRISVDDAAQDLFGLNIRGLVSIWALWAHPRRYFAAAQEPDWQKYFTPSIRLWLSLVALMSFLQFLWIGSDTPLVQAYVQGFKDGGAVPVEGMTHQDMGEQAALWIYGITPIFQAIGLVFLALIYPFWGQKTSFALRQRYVFATVVPSATLMLFILPSMGQMSIELVAKFGFVIAVIAFLTDFTTSFRGAFVGKSTGGKLWRSALLAGVILLFNAIAAIFVQIAGIVLVSSRYASLSG
ncbi:hypothetical protein [Parvularcula marina]|uniref:Yip1 domain-containing protein n=1 Tax=Parvularcula marina TaxID=2292771 RepID=A0A371RFN0_9PROT|nr:hypothetical protein [Parvularcula marina]RFB04235.1 hypothetical protein DX908_02410 [Parvularcula marina]